MMSAVIIVVILLVLALALEKEVMRKVRKFRFQKMLREEALPNFKSGGD